MVATQPTVSVTWWPSLRTLALTLTSLKRMRNPLGVTSWRRMPGVSVPLNVWVWASTITWPPTYVPIADIGGTIAYDLASGAIRAFNEYFADDGMTADQAWSTSHASLAEMLDAWLSS